MRDYDEIAKPLTLPIRGKNYTVAPVSARLGMQMLLAGGGEARASNAIKSMKTEQFLKELIGPAYDEMLADNVPLAAINRVFLSALADFQLGREAAEVVWETGESPEFRAALTAAAVKAEKPKRARSTAAATKTPPRVSSSGTSSRPATSSGPKVTARRSRGN